MRQRFSGRGLLTAALAVAGLGVYVWAQDANPGSLGDVARQTRAQHTADQGQTSKAQQLVDEMQQEQEASDNAPVGFKSYDAGEYRLFVPYPYSLEGRENGGAVLLGSRLGITNTEVMAGTPIQIPPNYSRIDIANLARQMGQQHASTAYCSAVKSGLHDAYHCSLSGAHLMGRQVVGDLEIVVASNALIPIMCVSPDDLRQCVSYDQYGYHTCNNRYPTWAQVQRSRDSVETRYRDERTTDQLCSQVIYPSIQLKEDIVVHPASISAGRTPKSAQPSQQETGGTTSVTQGPSLAELARETRLASHGQAQVKLDNADGESLAPPGFQSMPLKICQNPQRCTEAAVVIPEKAEIVSNVNGQRVFKTMLNGDPVLLYAGPADVNDPYRSMTDHDWIRIRDLANSNGWSREKADAVSTQELTIAGRPTLMTRFRYQRDQKVWWIGERALIDVRTSTYDPRISQFMLGCTAPEERFADAESLCTTLVNSLRLP
ncbi:MAG TPA: hypothetical protein VMH04_16320 [Candidatus Solibacter sp.]|nr:hypothetical protein [Candidatus Solibacter sp.]